MYYKKDMLLFLTCFLVMHAAYGMEEKSKTTTMTILPIIAAIAQAEKDFLSDTHSWNTQNTLQKTFVEKYLVRKDELAKLSCDELSAHASRDVEEINKYLSDRGFSIQLKPLTDPNGFAIASILNLLGKWRSSGKRSSVTHCNKFYPAVKMKSGYELYQSSKHAWPIVSLATENSDIVSLTPAIQPIQGFELLEYVNNIAEHKTHDVVVDNDGGEYDSVIFPMVDLDVQPDITWLFQMNKPNKQGLTNYITQTLQQTRFKMNQEGYIAQSAAAVTGEAKCRDFCSFPFTINQPFFAWITRPGMTLPLFAAYIGTEDWKNPNNE